MVVKKWNKPVTSLFEKALIDGIKKRPAGVIHSGNDGIPVRRFKPGDIANITENAKVKHLSPGQLLEIVSSCNTVEQVFERIAQIPLPK